MTQLESQRSQQIFEKAKSLFPGGVNSPVRSFSSVKRNPFIVSHGRGPYLHDLDGNRYIDYINSWGPLVLGHADPVVQESLRIQLEKGTSYGACCGLESDLAELIQKFFPSMEMLRFVSSGTEAGMSVIRLARGFTGRNKIVKFNGCYHGHADSLLVKAGSGVATLSIPGCAGVPEAFVENTLVSKFNDQDQLEKIFEEHDKDLACVILEPICGNAGLILPDADFLAQVRELCTRNKTLLIFDEVMTGFRVSLQGAQGLYRVEPDLTMLGKVIGGGLPVGAFGGRRDIMEYLAPLGPVYQAGTLSGNPLAMAAGIATLNEWSKPGVFETVAHNTGLLKEALLEISRANKVELTANSCGTMFGFFFCSSPVNCYEDAQRSSNELFVKFFNEALDQGVYFAPSMFEAGFVSKAHDLQIINDTINVLEKVFSSFNS